MILDIISDYDAVLETSHLDVSESKVLVEEARKKDIKIVVTHVGFITSSLSLEEQRWMAQRVALLELCYSSLSPAWRSISIDEVVNIVSKVGPEHYILASDLGQVHNPSPAEGLRIYIMMLLERGITPDEIEIMVKDNPERLLGLN
jgi:predicted metal-dependent TIM-barrel fold hydrolase